MKLKILLTCLLIALSSIAALAQNNTNGSISLPSEDYLGDLSFGPSSPSPFDWEASDLFNMSTSSTSYESTVSYFSEFYFNSGAPIVGGIVSTPATFNPSGNLPSTIYFGPGQGLTYSQYASSPVASRSSELWIAGASDWSRYVVAPAGSWLQLVSYVPTAGTADFYEIVGDNNVLHRQYPFYVGYNRMSFQADQVGRHLLLFVAGGLPSNAVIVDVIPASTPAPTPTPRATTAPTSIQAQQGATQVTSQGSSYGQAYGQATSQQSSFQMPTSQQTSFGQATYQQTTGSAPSLIQPAPTSGDTPVTIQTSLRGYQVFLDNAYIGTEGTGNDAPDGSFRFSLTGGQTHDVKIFDGQNYYGKPMYFERGVPKVINVPPAATVYF